jgi:hypothetical protein
MLPVLHACFGNADELKERCYLAYIYSVWSVFL